MTIGPKGVFRHRRPIVMSSTANRLPEPIVFWESDLWAAWKARNPKPKQVVLKELIYQIADIGENDIDDIELDGFAPKHLQLERLAFYPKSTQATFSVRTLIEGDVHDVVRDLPNFKTILELVAKLKKLAVRNR
jgi:hypothetical protein